MILQILILLFIFVTVFIFYIASVENIEKRRKINMENRTNLNIKTASPNASTQIEKVWEV